MKKETKITCPFCPNVLIEFDTDLDAFVCPDCGIDISLSGGNDGD